MVISADRRTQQVPRAQGPCRGAHVAVDLSATGDDDRRNKQVEAQADLRWRDAQLQAAEGRSVRSGRAGRRHPRADFALDDFAPTSLVS